MWVRIAITVMAGVSSWIFGRNQGQCQICYGNIRKITGGKFICAECSREVCHKCISKYPMTPELLQYYSNERICNDCLPLAKDLATRSQGQCQICGNILLKKTGGKILCAYCLKDVCSNCSEKAPLTTELLIYSPDAMICKNCLPMAQDVERKYSNALANVDNIVLWPATYKGNLPINHFKQTQWISSEWIQYKSKAERNLRIRALFDGFDILTEVTFNQRHANKGNYEYTEWQAIGLAGHRSD